MTTRNGSGVASTKRPRESRSGKHVSTTVNSTPWGYDLTGCTGATLARIARDPVEALGPWLVYDAPDVEDEWELRCPLHRDGSPSARVNFVRGVWNCFSGCGAGPVGELIWRMPDRDDPPDEVPSARDRRRPEVLPSEGTVHGAAAYLLSDRHWRARLHARGLSDAVLERFEIGREYAEFGRFTIPIRDADGTIVNVRRYRPDLKPKMLSVRGHGSPARLYPLPELLADDHDWVVICEGELDAVRLWQEDIPALTTTGGSGALKKWRDEWTEVLADRSRVVLIPDRDTEGEAWLGPVARALTDAAKDVRAVRLPYPMTKKHGKDVTDYLLEHDVEDLHGLMEEAATFAVEGQVAAVGERIADADGAWLTELEVPDYWKLSMHGIFITREGKDDLRVAYEPIVITERWVADDHTEALRLAWTRAGEWSSNVYDRDEVLFGQHLRALARDGAPIGGSNHSKLAEFLHDFEAANLKRIPVRQMTRRLGWVGDQFVANLDDSDVKFNGPTGTDELAEAHTRRGTRDQWAEAVAPLEHHPRAALGLYAALAAPLLRLFAVPSFTMDWSGETSVGKTTTLKIAASVWGSPGLVRSWDATEVAIEQMAGALNGLPLILDETKRARSWQTVADVIYNVSQGRGRERGDRNGGLRETVKWSTIVLSSGEQPITSFSSDGGTRARVVSVWGSPFVTRDRRLVRDLTSALGQHHGHAGPDFMTALLERRDEWPRWRDRYEELTDELAALSDNEVVRRRAALVAVLQATAGLAKTFGVLNWQPPEMFWASLLTTGAGADDDDLPRRALEQAWDWAVGTESRFGSLDREVHRAEPPRGWAGRWDNPSSELCWRTDVLRSVLRERDHESDAVVQVWAERGWLRHDKAGNNPPVRLTRDGSPARCVVIREETVAWLNRGLIETLPAPLGDDQSPPEVAS